MRDEIASLFESRDTRMSALPQEGRAKLQLLADQAAATGDKDFADREFTSLWLSKRMGVSRKEVLNNYGAITRRYFGKELPASSVYDAISAYYQSPEGAKAEEQIAAQEKEGEPEIKAYEADESYRKVGGGWALWNTKEGAKSFASGVATAGHQTAAGFYSQLATVTGNRIKSYYDDPEYRAMMIENAWLDPIAEADESVQTPVELMLQTKATPQDFFDMPESKRAKWREKAMAIKQRVDEQNNSSLREWDGSFFGKYSKNARANADFFYKLASENDQFYKVDPQFSQTTLGVLAKSAGSVPVTAFLSATGPGGLVGLESMFFGQVEQERMEHDGDKYDPASAFVGNIASAAPQMLLEKALGVERVLGKALSSAPKRAAGRLLFGDYVKAVGKGMLEGAIGEAIENPAQGIWNDFVASLAYDEKREVLTGEGAKRRLVEAYSGFILGGMFGGAVRSVEVYGQAKANKQAEEYILSRNGQQMTPADFTLLRSMRTDGEIMAGAVDADSGGILLKAVNGDEAAQQEYNKRVIDSVFVDTANADVGGMQLGEVDGVPVIRFDDQTIEPLNLDDPEHQAIVEKFKEQIGPKVQDAAAQDPKDAEREQRQRELDETFALLKPDAELRESLKLYEKLKADLAVQEAASKASDNESQLVPPLMEKLNEWADKKFAESQTRLYSGIDPELVAAAVIKTAKDVRDGIITFADWSKKLIKWIGDKIKPKLKDLYLSMRPKEQAEQDFELTGKPQTPEQELEARAMRLRAKRRAATGELLAAIAAKRGIPERVKAVRRSHEAGFISRIAAPIATRAEKVSLPLKYRIIREFELKFGRQQVASHTAVVPFLKGLEKMGKNDAEIFSLALMNGDVDTRDAILRSYNLSEAFQQVEAELERTYKRAVKAGFEVNRIENYFPRHILDLDSLLAHYYGREQAGVIEQALKEANKRAIAAGRSGLTTEERIEVTNRALRGYAPKKDGRPSNVKERKTDVVDMDAAKYYADPAHALLRYIDSMNTAIAKREFFGRHAVLTEENAEGRNQGINLDATIGAYVQDMVDKGNITAAQQQEVLNILDARFNQTIASNWVKNFRSLALLTAMGRITSTITQVQDLAYSLYFNGAIATVRALKSAPIKVEDMGLETMAAEFQDLGKLQKAVSWTLKAIGIRFVDTIGKQTLVNAQFYRMQSDIRKGKLNPRSKRILEATFTAEELPGVMADIQLGKKTDDTLLAVYNVLADVQPVNPSEYPEGYLKANAGKLYYTLRSYTIKQLDAFRRESFSLIASGDPKQIKQGFRNLTKMTGLLLLIGVPVDWLKDFIMGREPRLQDLAIDNMFKLMAVNRYSLWKLRNEGDLEKFAFSLIMPPAPFLSLPGRDTVKAQKQISKGEEIDIGDMESWRLIPVFGDFQYWWAGGGQKKVEERRAKLIREKQREIRSPYASR